MKASTPALMLYFSVCAMCVISYIVGQQWLAAYGKAIVIPSICYYYFASNHYRIDFKKAVIFLLCFVGDIVFLMEYENYFMISLLCFFGVYLLLLSYLIADFRKNKFRRIDFLPISIVVALLLYLLLTILNLKFDEAERYYETFLLYGITLAFLGAVCIMNYIARGSRMSTHAVIMFICFLLSDIFYLIENYYYQLVVFRVIISGTQLLSYYFMVQYFLLRKAVAHKQENS